MLTHDQAEAIRTLAAEGVAIREIAGRTGFARNTIRGVLRTVGQHVYGPRQSSSVPPPCKPAITYHGGKAKLAKSLIALMPPHITFVDVFGGSGAVMLAKPPSRVDIFNDLNGDIVNFFRVLRDANSYARLKHALENTPHSRAEFELSLERTDDPVERARRTLVCHRMSFGATQRAFGYDVEDGASVRKWVKAARLIKSNRDRFKSVQLENADWRKILERYDRPTTCFYLDPPYEIATRSRNNNYTHEMSHADHLELLGAANRLRGSVVLSGYATPEYDALTKQFGWARHAFDVPTYAGFDRSRRDEIAWVKPAGPAPTAPAGPACPTNRDPNLDQTADPLASRL